MMLLMQMQMQMRMRMRMRDFAPSPWEEGWGEGTALIKPLCIYCTKDATWKVARLYQSEK
jgi:hypothetical protein